LKSWIASVFAVVGLLTVLVPVVSLGEEHTTSGSVQRHELCGMDDTPESETELQGDVPRAEQESGRAEEGYNCGLALVGHEVLDFDGRSPTGNANMAWAGDCAYVAGSSAAFGAATPNPAEGLAVVDVSDPADPQHVKTLTTTASSTTLETLHAVEAPGRSVLVVGQYGNQSGGDKPMDIYDVTDCDDPVLLETFMWPENIHNLTISGNGRYVFATQPLQALDIEPLFDEDQNSGGRYLGNLEDEIEYPIVGVRPVADLDDDVPVRDQGGYTSHEAWPSPDGTRLYLGGQLPVFDVFTIVDITEWLTRDEDNNPAGSPEVISQRNGRGHSVRTATVEGKGGAARRLVLHSEESVFGLGYGCLPEAANPFAGPAEPWLTDITDESDPQLVTQFGLEINDELNCPAQIDSGVQASVHYHDVDDEENTTFAMLSMMNAGVRVFDIRDPEQPVEVAYFNPGDVNPGEGVTLDRAWGHVRYVAATGHIWFATAQGGFWVVELEPQVREHLALPDLAVEHPTGRPGTLGIELSLLGVAPDVAPYYCTLDTARFVAR
jgi:hypothetical protein